MIIRRSSKNVEALGNIWSMTHGSGKWSTP